MTKIINVLILGVTGHYGGSLTHGSNFLTKNLPEEVKRTQTQV